MEMDKWQCFINIGIAITNMQFSLKNHKYKLDSSMLYKPSKSSRPLSVAGNHNSSILNALLAQRLFVSNSGQITHGETERQFHYQIYRPLFIGIKPRTRSHLSDAGDVGVVPSVVVHENRPVGHGSDLVAVIPP